MNVEVVELDKIKKYDKNPRINDKAVDYVKKSIEDYGYLNPILINKDNVILAGHTRYDALKKLGRDKVEVIRVLDLSKDKEKAFRIADNKVAEYSYWDNEKLFRELKEVSKEMEENLKDIGFEYNDPNEYKIDEDYYLSNTDIPKKEIVCPFCGEKIE